MIKTEVTISRYYKPCAAFFIVTFLVAILLAIFFSPFVNWFYYPLVYSGDGLWNLFVTKTIVETGWYNSNSHLGAPLNAVFLDFAKPEFLHLSFIRLLALITKNNVSISNIFYFFGFFAVAWSALWVLRSGLRLEWLLAIAGSIIYTLLPFHFLRIDHLFLSNYFVVPLMVWVALQLNTPSPPFYEQGYWSIGSLRIWFILFMLSSTSIYYSYFAVMLVIFSGLIETLRCRSSVPIISASMIILVLMSMLFVNLSSSLLYQWRTGPNTMIAQRTFSEGDRLALRPMQLLMPTINHHMELMAKPAKSYAEKMEKNETASSSLGLIASLGFIILCIHLLSGQVMFKGITSSFHCLARLNAVAVSLGIAGGINAFISFFFVPYFRGMNRISVVIGFIALAGLLLLIDHAMKNISSSKRKGVTIFLVALLLAIAVWDQIPNKSSMNDLNQSAYTQDRFFFKGLEQKLPQQAMVFQLPYIKFPETPPLANEGSYAQLKPFLHTTHLRWSFGGMKNRLGDLWQEGLNKFPINAQLQVLERAGFEGILIQRKAYLDQGKKIEDELRAEKLVATQESVNKQFVYYSFPTKMKKKSEIIPTYYYGQGFYQEEINANDRWIWSSGNASLMFCNLDSKDKHIVINFSLNSRVPRIVQIAIENRQLKMVKLSSDMKSNIELEITLKPGKTKLDFTTDVPSATPGPNDSRLLAFSLLNLQFFCKAPAS